MSIGYIRILICSFSLLFLTSSLLARVPIIWHSPKINEFFVGREDILSQIVKLFKTRYVVAITGMPGIGKTQVAKEYVHRFHAQYDIIWWFDVRVDIYPQLKALGAQLNRTLPLNEQINYRELSPEDAKECIKNTLRKIKLKWLLVFDNVQDNKFMEEFFPKEDAHGKNHILVTSQLTLGWPASVRVGVLTRKDSVDLLLKTIKTKDRNKLDELACLLSDYPLALVQVGHFLKFNLSSQIEDYMTLFEHERDELLRREEDFIRQHNDIIQDCDRQHEAFHIALKILIDKVLEEEPDVGQTLKKIAVLFHRNIPKDFLESPATERQKRFFGVILEKYGILEASTDFRDSYSMHEMLQKTLVDRMINEELKNELMTVAEEVKDKIILLRKREITPTEEEALSLVKHAETVSDRCARLGLVSSHITELRIHLVDLYDWLERGYLISKELLDTIDDNIDDLINPTALLTYYPFRATYFHWFEADCCLEGNKEFLRQYIAKIEEMLSSSYKSGSPHHRERAAAHFHLGQLYLVLGEFDKVKVCLEALEKFAEDLPVAEKINYLYLKSTYALKNGLLDEALQSSDRLRELYPHIEKSNKIAIISQRSIILARKENYKDAQVEANEALLIGEGQKESKPLHIMADAMLALAMCYGEKGQIKEAQALIANALERYDNFYHGSEKNVDQAYAHVICGEIKEGSEDVLGAREEYQLAEKIYNKVFVTQKNNEMAYLYEKLAMNAIKRNDEVATTHYFDIMLKEFGKDCQRLERILRALKDKKQSLEGNM